MKNALLYVNMFGFILVLGAALAEEVGDSIGKSAVVAKKESIYTFGFLMLLWSTIFLLASAFIRDNFIFSLASLPTLGIRSVLEIAQAHVSVLAVTRADRSTYGFLRILTIPLLLVVDMVLGYTIGTYQILGMGIIIAALVVLFINHGIKKEGAWLVVFTAINAVATISLYKYNISHFNSVEVEQVIVHAVLLVYFVAMALLVAKENPLQFLRKPLFFGQSVTMGAASALMSFAYLFGAASVITTVKRAAGILWALLSGNLYFQEKQFLVKMASFILIVIGPIFLAS